MNALFVVQSDFLHSHVGVRRVTLYYMAALKREGYQVELAALKDGQLECLRLETSTAGKKTLYWTGQVVKRSDYATVIITNPWLCAEGLPDLPDCVGIVHDMVPNLIAAGCLRFSNVSSIYKFAHAHNIGYRYYLRNARRICCVSESTRKDFLELYGPISGGLEVAAHIPFQAKARTATESGSKRVLLVNALDARKNLAGITEVLEQAHSTTPIQLDIVGQARSSKHVIDNFFSRLNKAGIAYKLHQDITDETLQSLYRSASVLLFPSLYEGLGLPVLEAQQEGLPAITTNISSLPEINLNPSLCFAADDTAGMARAVREIVTGQSNVLRGEALRSALVARLAQQPRASDVLVVNAKANVNAFQPQASESRPLVEPDKHQPITVAWKGSFLDHGSLSQVNRELVGALKNFPGTQIQCVTNGAPIAPDAATIWPELMREVATKSAPHAAITVRHAWPPNWKRPAAGKLVVIQPWEFGSLPEAWVKQSADVDEFWIPSEYVRRVYVESGVPESKVVVVPNGVNVDKFNPQAKPMTLAKQKKFKFLFVGGTIGRKGPDLLLQAYLKNFTAADDVCLVIKDFGGKSVYNGQTFETQIRAAQQLPDAPEILYLNKELSPDELPGLYAACQCLVLPYRGEGFGLPVLEAMACGLPVIVTAGGPTDDFVTDEFAWRIPATRRQLGGEISGMKLVAKGWMLEPDVNAVGQSMRAAFNNPEQTRARGEIACRHARENFTWQKAAAIAAQRLNELGASAQSLATIATKVPTTKTITIPAVAKIGRLDEARELLAQKNHAAAWNETLTAIAKRPFHPEALMLLAEIALASGDGKSAKLCAQHARTLVPGWQTPKQFLAKPLKGDPRHAWLDTSILAPRAPRLSVCLIAKNEEKFLAQCLKSVRGLATQIIVADTGSTDRTIEIAKEFGAEIYSFPWCDDFGAARNAAIEHATGDWILILDADEELPAEQHAKLLADIKNSAMLGFRLPLVNVGQENEGRSFIPRLFRNAPDLFFHGRIHEQVFSSLLPLCKKYKMQTALGSAEILHHGYSKEMVRDRNKVGRNLHLLQQAIAENPADANLLMNLGLELVRSEKLIDGITQYRAAFEVMSAQPANDIVPELREALLTQFTSQLYKVRGHHEVVEVLTSPLAKNGMTASLHFSLGLSLFELKQFSDAAKQMRECIAKKNSPALTPVNTDIFSAAPWHCLALCLARTEAMEEADAAFQSAIAEPVRNEAARLDYAKFLRQQNRPVDALQQLNAIIGLNPRHAEAWTFGGEIVLGHPEFLEFAREWTGEAFKNVPENFSVATQRAEVLLLSGEVSAAMELWKNACHAERHPRLLAALILCEVAEAHTTHAPDANDERATSLAFIEWYRRLITTGAGGVAAKVNRNLESLASALPTAAEMIGHALATAAN